MSKVDIDQAIRDVEAGRTPKWITEHVRVYRESGGSEGHLFDATSVGGNGVVPSLLLTTIGRRSGAHRTSPLFYGTTDKGYVVIGSKGGADTQPGWYLNLLATTRLSSCRSAKRAFQCPRGAYCDRPRTRTTLGADEFRFMRPYRDYQKKTKREIPVIVLEKQGLGVQVFLHGFVTARFPHLIFE